MPEWHENARNAIRKGLFENEKAQAQMMILTQGENVVSALQGEVPVIPFHSCEISSRCAWAANFLRSGHPAVQMVDTSSDADWEKDRGAMGLVFRKLELGQESFDFDFKKVPIIVVTLGKRKK